MGVITLRFAGVCLPDSPGGIAVGGLVIESEGQRFLGFVIADETRQSCQAMADWGGLAGRPRSDRADVPGVGAAHRHPS